MADLATAYLTLVPSLKGAQSEIEKQLKGINVSKPGTSIGNSLGDAMSGSLLGKIGGGMLSVGSTIANTLVKPVVAGVTAIGAAVTGVAAVGGISRALKLEQAQFMLKGLGYEGAQLESIMKTATDAVSGTAFGLDSAATAASLLAASGIDVETQLSPALRAVTGIAAMTGTSMEEIADIMSEVAAQGKVSGDTLNRLSARGINATQVLGEALGKTSEEIKKMVSKGEVDFDTFARVMNEKFGDAAYGANETFSGAMANVRAALSRVGQAFAEPALQNLTKIFAAAIPAINAVNAALKPVAEAFSQFANTVGGQVVSALNQFTENMNGGMPVIEAFGKLFEDLGPAFDTFTDGIANAIETGLPALLEGIGAMAGPLMDAAVRAFAGICEALMNALLNAREMIPGAIHDIEAWLIDNGPTILLAATELFVGIVGALVTVIETIMVDIATFIADLCSNIAGAAGDMLSAAGEFFSGIVTSLFMVVAEATFNLASALGTFVNAVATGVGMMLSAAMTFFSGIPSAIANTVGSAVSAIASLISSVVGRVSGAVGEMASAATNMIQGMVQGILGGAGAVVGAIQNVISGALSAAKSALGIASPSKVMRKMFRFVGDGMALGLADSESTVVNAMEDVIDGAYDAASRFSPTLALSGAGSGSGLAMGSTYNFNGITINAQDRTMDEVFAELMAYANRSRVMMGVR